MYRLTPKEEVSARVRALQRRLGRDGVGAAFLVQNADLFSFTVSIPPGGVVSPVATFQRFSGLFPGTKAVDVSKALREIRAVKGPSEIEAMRACGRNLSGLLEGARGEIRPGLTEIQLGGVLQGRGISAGHTTMHPVRAPHQGGGLGGVVLA